MASNKDEMDENGLYIYDSFVMQFGIGMSERKNNLYTNKKKYKYIDKRTKKYGLQRKHKGEMNKYNTKK